ncbi:hypothetical protein PCK2_000766 [Pneumocystis canis]|nr:hypothetical protein PCK2_000766 [Pneumocystis canis]
MKEQQKHSCSCSVCDRKRVAIEEELEMLYDAYYEELEQYANQHQKFNSLSLLRKNSLTGRPEDLEDSEGILDSDGDYDESILSESMDPRFDFFNFGNSLTVKVGGILTVADDLLKNDGKKFIEMMEHLAERRIQRELQKQLKDQEKARKEAERLAEENALRAEEEKRLDEAKKKKEELRLKREAEKKALEEEKRRQIQDKEKELEKEKKRKEAEKERQKKELTVKKDKEVKENESKLRNLKEKDELKQSIPETIPNNATIVNRSPQVENRDSFYSITEPIKELRTPVSNSLNSSSMFSLKTEQESDNSLPSSSIMFSQPSAGLQNTSQKSPHISATNLNSILQHPPGFDTTPGQNFSSTHSTYQPLASPRPMINNTSTGIFSSTSIPSNQQYDYSSLKLFKASSNNYKGEASSLSPKLNNYNSLPTISTTAFFRPFPYLDNKDHNNIAGIHEELFTFLVNRHMLNSQESRHRNISDQSWLYGLSDSRFSDVWLSNTSMFLIYLSYCLLNIIDWNNQHHITQNLLRQRCKLICLRLDEQYGSKTRLFLIDQVLNLYNDLFSDSPVQLKQILDACAISGNSQNGGGFFTCKIEGRHVMIRYDDVIDQSQCKSGFPNPSTMIFPSSSSSIGPQSRWSINSSATGAF